MSSSMKCCDRDMHRSLEVDIYHCLVCGNHVTAEQAMEGIAVPGDQLLRWASAEDARIELARNAGAVTGYCAGILRELWRAYPRLMRGEA